MNLRYKAVKYYNHYIIDNGKIFYCYYKNALPCGFKNEYGFYQLFGLFFSNHTINNPSGIKILQAL